MYTRILLSQALKKRVCMRVQVRENTQLERNGRTHMYYRVLTNLGSVGLSKLKEACSTSLAAQR
jgi:hypothetical protein